VEGRGEIVNSIPPLSGKWVVLAMPPVPTFDNKTRELYDSLNAGHYTGGEYTARLVEVLRAGRGFDSSYLFNTFENVAYTRFSGLETAREHFLKLGAPFVHLAGSGPALYTLMDNKAEARELCVLLEKQNMKSYLVEI
jgi:4-diphosphocytidyl-2-C-methyl-D-erythritol kinase